MSLFDRLVKLEAKLMSLPYIARFDRVVKACRSCQAPIVWCVTKAGRRIPMNVV